MKTRSRHTRDHEQLSSYSRTNRITDPQADYEIYWLANFFRNLPLMYMTLTTGCRTRSLMEACHFCV